MGSIARSPVSQSPSQVPTKPKVAAPAAAWGSMVAEPVRGAHRGGRHQPVADQALIGRSQRGDQLGGRFGQPGVIPGDPGGERLTGGVEQKAQGQWVSRPTPRRVAVCGASSRTAAVMLAFHAAGLARPGPAPRCRVRDPGPGENRAVRGDHHRLGGRCAHVDSEVGIGVGVLRISLVIGTDSFQGRARIWSG